MNEDQITKFVNACKNAGFEVEGREFKTTINFGCNGFVSIQTMWDGELEVEYGLYAYEENSTSEWKEVIATYLIEAIKRKHPLVSATDCDGMWDIGRPMERLSKAEKFADAVFEAFCEVYK